MSQLKLLVDSLNLCAAEFCINTIFDPPWPLLSVDRSFCLARPHPPLSRVTVGTKQPSQPNQPPETVPGVVRLTKPIRPGTYRT